VPNLFHEVYTIAVIQSMNICVIQLYKTAHKENKHKENARAFVRVRACVCVCVCVCV